MKIVNKKLGRAADVSSGRGTAFREFRSLVIALFILSVGVYLSIGFVVDTVVTRISYETEASLFGSGLFWDLKRAQDDSRMKNAKAVLDTLDDDSQVPPLEYTLAIVDLKEPNAFAFPGGTIGLTPGLLDTLQDDISLAFVLGHELGHFHNRDHLRGIGRAIGVSAIFSIIFGGQMGNEALGTVIQSVIDRGYSREQEEKADQYAIELVFRVYGKTEGVDRLFSIIEKKNDIPNWAYMFATHPSPRSRIQNLKKHAQRLKR